jgi:hypothetical protein
MATRRYAELAGPQNGRIRTLAKKSSQTFDRWAVGCNLVVLKMACSQSHCKIQALAIFRHAVRAIQGA